MESKVGIYARISRSEDKTFHSSVEHQIEGITEYCNSHHFSITKTYKDIGYSGSTFDRPALKAMLKDIEDGSINTVIVKDLSRFGRNHLEVGKYLDEIFLIQNIRFIAIEDNYDNKGLMDEFASFKNIFNEMYSKDIKRKIRSTFDYKAKTKLLNPRLGAFYGLTIDENKALIIDEETAPIVRKIYALYIQGYSTKQIADQLNIEKIISPGLYRYNKYKDKSGLSNQKNIWRDCSVYKILTNEGYIGKIINHKYIYVHGKKVRNPHPIILENGLPQIIEKEVFAEVQKIRLNRPKKKEKVYVNPYPNRIHCGCCNKIMRYTYSSSMNQYLFLCKNCKTRIYLEDLKYILKSDINQQIDLIKPSDINTYNEKQDEKMKNNRKQIEVKIQKCFEGYTKGEIPEANLKQMIDDLTKEKNKLSLDRNIQLPYLFKEVVSKCNIEEVLLQRIISKVSIANIDKRKYKVNIVYNFKL